MRVFSGHQCCKVIAKCALTNQQETLKALQYVRQSRRCPELNTKNKYCSLHFSLQAVVSSKICIVKSLQGILIWQVKYSAVTLLTLGLLYVSSSASSFQMLLSFFDLQWENMNTATEYYNEPSNILVWAERVEMSEP